jgi:hypothetical protein
MAETWDEAVAETWDEAVAETWDEPVTGVWDEAVAEFWNESVTEVWNESVTEVWDEAVAETWDEAVAAMASSRRIHARQRRGRSPDRYQVVALDRRPVLWQVARSPVLLAVCGDIPTEL